MTFIEFYWRTRIFISQYCTLVTKLHEYGDNFVYSLLNPSHRLTYEGWKFHCHTQTKEPRAQSTVWTRPKNEFEQQYGTNKNIFWLVAGPQSEIIFRRWWRMFFCFALPPQILVNHSEPLVTVPAAFLRPRVEEDFRCALSQIKKDYYMIWW